MKASTAKILAAKHWREFAPVKAWAARAGMTSKEELDDIRYGCYAKALGPPPRGKDHWSLSDLRGARFDEVITEFRRQAGLATLADGFRATNARQISLLHVIAGLGLCVDTIAHIARDKFAGAHWATLRNEQLSQLLMTCKRHAATLQAPQIDGKTPSLVAEAERLKTEPTRQKLA